MKNFSIYEACKQESMNNELEGKIVSEKTNIYSIRHRNIFPVTYFSQP